MGVPSFDITEFPSQREAVLQLLGWLKGRDKAASVAFVVGWFGLKDHRMIQRI